MTSNYRKLALYRKWEIHSKIRLSDGESVSWYGKNESVIWTRRHFPEGICLESTLSTEDKTFLVSNCIIMSISKEKSANKKDPMRYSVCTVCSSRRIDQSCFFECPPAVQECALSRIPSNLDIFPTSSIFANMDHLYWRVIPKMENHQFAWILWYIWKIRNNMVFSNINITPQDTLRLA